MAFLNGQHAADSTIDPAKHRFTGLFRYPFLPLDIPSPERHWFFWWVRTPAAPLLAYRVCQCGQPLSDNKIAYEHWHMGHSDIPKYVNELAAPKAVVLPRKAVVVVKPKRDSLSVEGLANVIAGQYSQMGTEVRAAVKRGRGRPKGSLNKKTLVAL